MTALSAKLVAFLQDADAHGDLDAWPNTRDRLRAHLAQENSMEPNDTPSAPDAAIVERPNDYTPPTYYTCSKCGCGFDERPVGFCPACKTPIASPPLSSVTAIAGADTPTKKGGR